MRDLGAQGVLLPINETVDDVEEFAKYLFYPPKGKRGVCLSRVNLSGDCFESYRKTFCHLFIPQITRIQEIKTSELNY